MLRRASEIFLGSEQKSLVKASLSYISAERHDLRCLHRDGEDTLDIELKWCVSDHVEEARKQKLLAIDLGKSLHTFEHVAVGIDVLQESCSERGEEKAVRVSLETTTREPKLDTVTFHSLGTGSEALSLHLVLGDSEIADIQRIRVQEGAQLSFFKWIDNFSFAGLTQLDCSCCGIGVFPESLGELGQQLRSLNLSQNKLVELPNKVVRKLIKLEVLIASHNALTALPASLSTLMMLETLNLEDNRLTTIICPFNKLIRLKRLLLKGNSLLYLPPLVGNTTLQELSIANLVIRGNVAEEHPGGGEDCLDSHQLKYEGVATIFSETTSFLTPLKKAMLSNKWIPFFDLFVGRSEAHPLVLSAILQAFEDKEACEYVASQERGVLQQLVLLTLSNDVDVVKRSSQCLISAFSKCDIMDRLLENNMQQCVSTLLGSEKVIDQEAGIKLLSHITFTSDQFSRHIFSDTILTLLANITCKQAMKWMTRERKVSHLSAPKSESEFKENLFGLDICGKALECMGNLALSVENREKMAGNDALLNAIEMVISLGNKFIAKERGIEVLLGKKSSNGSPRKEAEREKRLLRSREISDSAGICVRCALRVMAILGLNQKLDDILHSVAGKRRGIRILSIDGGGSKGRCALEMCRVMERKTGKLICDLFDLIVGTSTGSIIAMGLGALAMRVEEVEEAYDTLTTVFKNSQGKNSDSGWVAEMSSLYIAGTQNIRALFKGCMYNHELLEDFYKRWAKIPDVVDDERFCAFSRSMINLAPLGRPRVACVASLTNVARDGHYKERMSRVGGQGLEGTSSFSMWQSLRASTAAPLYVEGYVHNQELLLQDGALCSNNPVVIGFQEASCIWPDQRVEVVVSLGNGVPKHELMPPKQKTVMETMLAVMESATSVDRDHSTMEGIAAYLKNPTNHISCKYYRFQPEDERCDLLLDEVNETKLALLKEAYTEYIQSNDDRFDEMCEALVRGTELSETEVSIRGGDSNIGRNHVSNAVDAMGVHTMKEPSQDGFLTKSAAPQAPPAVARNGAVCIQDFTSQHEVQALSSRCVYEACWQNEACELKVLSSEYCLAMESDKMAKTLGNAFLIHLDCIALDEGFVARWSEEETFSVVESTAEAKNLLQEMVAHCARMREGQGIPSHEPEPKTFGAFFHSIGSKVICMTNRVLVHCESQTISKSSLSLSLQGTPATTTVCTFECRKPQDVFSMSSRQVSGKAIVCSYPIPMPLRSYLLKSGAAAVIGPKLRHVTQVAGDAQDLARVTKKLANSFYSKILETRDPRLAWNWLRENHAAAAWHNFHVTF